MQRLVIILIIISLFILDFVIRRKKINIEKEKDVKKNLATSDKIGIKHLIILFLVLCVDIIDIFDGSFLYDNYRKLFFLAYNIEFICWIFLIPVLFVVVLVNLIKSFKQKKNGRIIITISLILNVVTELVTLGTYASHF